MDRELLRRQMRRQRMSQERLAGMIGMERSTFYRKMRGTGKGFYAGEICAIGKALELTRADLTEIFLNEYGR